MTDFVFHLDRPSGAVADTGLTYEVVPAGTNGANGADFIGGVLPSGTGGFPQGVLRWTITAAVNPDNDQEPDEGFDVVVKKNGVEVARARGTILNDDVSGEAPYIVYGDVADATPAIYRTSRPLVARAGTYRDGSGTEQNIVFKTLMLDASNYCEMQIHINQAGDFMKLLSQAFVNGVATFNGFNNVDLPVDITFADISIELLANNTMEMYQVATANSKKSSDGTAVAAGTRKLLRSLDLAATRQLAQRGNTAPGDGVQILRAIDRQYGGSGKTMKNVALGTPA